MSRDKRSKAPCRHLRVNVGTAWEADVHTPKTNGRDKAAGHIAVMLTVFAMACILVILLIGDGGDARKKILDLSSHIVTGALAWSLGVRNRK